MFGKKKDKHQTENNLSVEKTGTSIEILVTEEDKTGSNIMCMSDFFDVAVQQMSNSLVCTKDDLEIGDLPVSDLGIVNDALQTVGAFCSPQFDLVPDFASLPKEILEKYRAGKLTLGDSKQVEGNIRAVLVDVETDVVNDDLKEMAKNVAMQAAALKPMFTSRDEVSAEYIAKETEILTAAAKNEKPDANDKIIEGMVKGRINKELKETCLLDQVYVKAEDGKQSVAQYVASVAKANGANVTIKKFVRFETGEGLEKKNEDFAAEVAKQMGN